MSLYLKFLSLFILKESLLLFSVYDFLSSDFVNNNKDKCHLIINGLNEELCEFYKLDNNMEIIKVKLNNFHKKNQFVLSIFQSYFISFFLPYTKFTQKANKKRLIFEQKKCISKTD